MRLAQDPGLDAGVTRAAGVERRSVGGPCPNIGRLLSENIINGANAAFFSRRSEEFGLAQVRWCIDVAAVHDRMRRRIDVLTEMHRDKLQASCAELHDSAGREPGRCCPATGLNVDNILAAAGNT